MSEKSLKANNPMVKFLSDYMEKNNLNQKAMAQKLGMDESNFSKVMSGKRKISRLDHIQKIVLECGSDMNKFYKDYENKKEKV